MPEMKASEVIMALVDIQRLRFTCHRHNGSKPDRYRACLYMADLSVASELSSEFHARNEVIRTGFALLRHVAWLLANFNASKLIAFSIYPQFANHFSLCYHLL